MTRPVIDGDLLARLGDTVRDHREDYGLTQLQLANRVGVSRQQVCNIESGRYWPGGLTLLRLLVVLDIDVRQLTG